VRLANDLAFSCEAANAMRECAQNIARLRLLQRLVSWQERDSIVAVFREPL
jgi:hypothetical protein